VAGTGTDTRPNRVLNPVRQAERFDPEGTYVRRWVPELAALERPAIYRPWTLGPERLGELGYPPPLVDHDAAASALRAGGPSAPRTGPARTGPT
jgi:deoxyribodipyrimidine photo-lyase